MPPTASRAGPPSSAGVLPADLPRGTAITEGAGSRALRRRPLLVVGAALLVVAAAVAFWLLRGDEPREVDAERALDQTIDDEPEPEPAPDEDPEDLPVELPEDDEADDEVTPDEPEPGEQPEHLTGVWVVDVSRPFDRAEGLGTFVGYRVEEELSTIGSNTAVGRSPTVEGTVAIADTTVTEAVVEALLDDLESDDARRDSRVRDLFGLDTWVRFELTDPIELPEVPPLGEVVELDTTGVLTIKDVSHEVVVHLQAAVTADGLLVAGSTPILLSDFDLEAPTAPIVLSVSDEVVVEWQLFLTRLE